jgi:hypothetical protein
MSPGHITDTDEQGRVSPPGQTKGERHAPAPSARRRTRRHAALRQQARRGWIVLTDAMYLVRGPEGERQVCRPCIERCPFRRYDEDDDGECLTNADGF